MMIAWHESQQDCQNDKHEDDGEDQGEGMKGTHAANDAVKTA